MVARVGVHNGRRIQVRYPGIASDDQARAGDRSLNRARCSAGPGHHSATREHYTQREANDAGDRQGSKRLVADECRHLVDGLATLI